MYLATYDLNRGQSEFIDAALDLGWTRLSKNGNQLRKLPETTIRGQFPTRGDARTAFDTAVANAQATLGRPITVEKRMIVLYSEAETTSNKTAPVNPLFVGATELETCLEHQRNGVL